MFREVLAGGLLALLAPAAWGAGGDAKTPEPSPESCVHSPTARCVIRLSLAAVEGVAQAGAGYSTDWPAAFTADALARIAEAQANAGDAGEARNSLSRALAAVDGIDTLIVFRGLGSTRDMVLGARALIFSLIARIQTDMGDTGEARKTFSRAVAAVESITSISDYPDIRYSSLGGFVEIAKMQIAAGALQEARQTLARAAQARQSRYLHSNFFWSPDWLSDRSGGLPLFLDLVRAQAEAGDVAGALVTIRTILGDEGAREFVEHWGGSLADSLFRALADQRFRALARVAAVQAAAGDDPGALVTAGEIESGRYRMEAMRHIGIARAKRGDVAGAWDAARKIRLDSRLRDDMGARDVGLAQAGIIDAIAEAHMVKGEFEKALAAAMDKGMVDDLTLIKVRMAVAKARIAAGHFDAARGGAEAICDRDGSYRRHCVEVLADLAAALAAAGSADASREVASRALAEADRVVYDPDRARAFIAAYTALMRAGDVEAARRAFSSALAATVEWNDAYRQPEEFVRWRAEEFVRMEAAAVREGDFDSADRVLAASDHVDERVQALVRTGLAWTRAGDTDIARTMFSRAVAEATTTRGSSMRLSYRRAKTLAGIAFALASGQWPAADDYPDHLR